MLMLLDAYSGGGGAVCCCWVVAGFLAAFSLFCRCCLEGLCVPCCWVCKICDLHFWLGLDGGSRFLS